MQIVLKILEVLIDFLIDTPQGLVGLVTGGASGLGRASVEQLVKQGGRVVICDLPNSPGQETAKQLKENVAFVPVDVSHRITLHKLIL